MTSKYIGIVYEERTKEIRSVINPDYDEQLDFESHVTSPGEHLKMLRIDRGDLPETFGFSTCYYVTKIAEKILESL
jgi:hypothetical protein